MLVPIGACDGSGSGGGGATFEVYDVATNSWTTRAPMPTRRGRLGLAVGSDSRDPATNTWTARVADAWW